MGAYEKNTLNLQHIYYYITVYHKVSDQQWNYFRYNGYLHKKAVGIAALDKGFAVSVKKPSRASRPGRSIQGRCLVLSWDSRHLRVVTYWLIASFPCDKLTIMSSITNEDFSACLHDVFCTRDGWKMLLVESLNFSWFLNSCIPSSSLNFTMCGKI